MAFTFTAVTGQQLFDQINAFTATLPEGVEFPVNFGSTLEKQWWCSYSGHYDRDRLTFRELVQQIQTWAEDCEAGIEASQTEMEWDWK